MTRGDALTWVLVGCVIGCVVAYLLEPSWALLTLAVSPLLLSITWICLWARQLPWEETYRDQRRRGLHRRV